MQNGRLKVTRLGETQPIWWVDEDHLTILTAAELTVELPPIVDLEFYEDAMLAARMLSGFLGSGGMNVEYLLLLAWAESGWTNTDSQGRDGSDADLSGPVGPYRFDADLWSSILEDRDYEEVLRGFAKFDRIKPQVQCFFAAALANRLQRALVSKIPGLDPPAWLLRIGHRIGKEAVVRFAQLADADAVSTSVGGVRAVSAATVNANTKLFANKSDTTKSEVLAAVRAEFESGKRAVVKRLTDLLKLSAIDGMIDGTSPDTRRGALGFLDFIAKYESAGNYNAVVDRVRNENSPRLVSMSIEQILKYQKNTLGRRNACGKYQIVEGTLKGNYAAAGLSRDHLFDADGQDQIAFHLLMTVRKGDAFLRSDRGQAAFDKFALAVAQEWAAMPVLKAMTGHNGVSISRGDSYYSGTGGNRALTTAEEFEAAIRKFMNEVR
ncbi:hypothetical protein [Sinorhizobium meliloti]|uniref:hypothetical protein n=1 Tax=Rhizobium meliloti TaxID=382 RepID=UPI001F3C764E|nr:hypothetical protein [Sinorhizobium meliloti]